MKTFLAGLIFGVIAVPLAVYFYFASGNAPVATSAEAMPFEKLLARKAMHARMEKELPKTVPIQGDEGNLAAGAKIYRDDCAVCHGLPGQPKTAIAAGMYPKPPKLMDGKGVTDDEPGESYWKITNGIRLTGMPGFHESLTETQMWQVSLLVAQADKLPKAVMDTLSAPLAATPEKGAPAK